MNRVTITANLLIPVLTVFTALYVYLTAGDTLDFSILSPERWYNSDFVHRDASIATSTRYVYLSIWLLPIAFGLFAIQAAVRLLLLIRVGVVFDPRVGSGLRWVGFGVSASGIADLFANFISPPILSWHNPQGALPPAFYFDSEPAGLIRCGGGFYLVGWIMSEAIRFAKENNEFV
jgi:hypothetical protein